MKILNKIAFLLIAVILSAGQIYTAEINQIKKTILNKIRDHYTNDTFLTKKEQAKYKLGVMNLPTPELEKFPFLFTAEKTRQLCFMYDLMNNKVELSAALVWISLIHDVAFFKEILPDLNKLGLEMKSQLLNTAAPIKLNFYTRERIAPICENKEYSNLTPLQAALLFAAASYGRFQNTPAHESNPEIISLLLENGANPNQKNLEDNKYPVYVFARSIRDYQESSDAAKAASQQKRISVLRELVKKSSPEALDQLRTLIGEPDVTPFMKNIIQGLFKQVSASEIPAPKIPMPGSKTELIFANPKDEDAFKILNDASGEELTNKKEEISRYVNSGELDKAREIINVVFKKVALNWAPDKIPVENKEKKAQANEMYPKILEARKNLLEAISLNRLVLKK